MIIPIEVNKIGTCHVPFQLYESQAVQATRSCEASVDAVLLLPCVVHMATCRGHCGTAPHPGPSASRSHGSQSTVVTGGFGCEIRPI